MWVHGYQIEKYSIKASKLLLNALMSRLLELALYKSLIYYIIIIIIIISKTIAKNLR